MNVDSIKSNFQFIGNQIKTITLKNDFIELPSIENLKRFIDVTYEISDVHLVPDTNKILGVVELHVWCKAEDKESDEEMVLEMCISGCFIDEAVVKEEDFKEMLSLNGCATLYGIARAIVISLSSQSMDGGQLILPMVNFFKLKNHEEENQEK